MVGSLITRERAVVLDVRAVRSGVVGTPATVECLGSRIKETSDVAPFLAAVERAAAVRHKNLVAIEEWSVDEGELHLVLERLDGVSAAALLEKLHERDRTLDFALAAWIVAEASAGLAAAHGAGVLHQHLSPREVFLGWDGSVRVLGLGTAAVLDDLAPAKIRADELAYASPERCKGDKLDERSDVFGLGSILWELMCGVSPFERRTEASTIRAIISEDPAPPPSTVLRDMPTLLAEIGSRALAQEPAKRYASPRALRQELLTFVRGQGKAGWEPEAALRELVAQAFERSEPPAEDGDRPTIPASDLGPDGTGPVMPIGEAAVAGPSPEIPAETGSDSIEELPPLPPILPEEDLDPVVPMGKRRSSTLAFVLVAALLLVAGVVFVLRQGGSGGERTTGTGAAGSAGASSGQAPIEPPGTAAASAIAPPSPAAASASARPPAGIASAGAETTIQIDTVPPKATVLVGAEVRGTTPMALTLAKGSAPVTVEIRRPGYQPLREEIVPDVDQRLRLTLLPAPGGRPAATSSSPYYRFE